MCVDPACAGPARHGPALGSSEGPHATHARQRAACVRRLRAHRLRTAGSARLAAREARRGLAGCALDRAEAGPAFGKQVPRERTIFVAGYRIDLMGLDECRSRHKNSGAASPVRARREPHQGPARALPGWLEGPRLPSCLGLSDWPVSSVRLGRPASATVRGGDRPRSSNQVPCGVGECVRAGALRLERRGVAGQAILVCDQSAHLPARCEGALLGVEGRGDARVLVRGAPCWS